jgi:hypothetical protein
MVGALMRPRPRFGAVQEPRVSVPHIAVGLCVATVLVLLLPGPRGSRRRPDEQDLLRAQGIVMGSFGLL